jgi:thiamine-phosphate pyrophosphorylase
MIFYAITDRALAPRGDLLLQASGLIRGGTDWLQIREKDLADRTLFCLLKMLVPEARRFGCRLLLNGRPDLAFEAGVSGVHLPSTGLPTSGVRACFPRPFMIVRSCHAEQEVLAAARDGADAVTLGPLFETPSKSGMGSHMGLEALSAICGRSRIPVFALGGIGAADLPRVARTGVAGVAAIRMFCALGNPIRDLAGLRDATRR